MRSAAISLIALALSTSTAVARADDAYEVMGEAEGRACKGVVVTRPVDDDGGGGLEVKLTYRFEQEPRTIEVLTGRGARRGDALQARVLPVAGAVDALERVGGAPTPARAERALELVLEDGGARWRVTVREGERAVMTGAGATKGEPGLEGSAASRWAAFEGVPFVKGSGDPTEVHTSDPRQGQLGDCYLIAGMIALANTEPGRARLRGMITERDDGFEVALRGEGQFLIERQERNDEKVDPRLHYDDRVRVDRRLPVDSAGELVFAGRADTRRDGERVLLELWPNLIERAYAQSAGSYEAIRSGWSGDVFRIAGGAVTRHKAATMTDAEVERVLRDALRGGHAICVSSAPKVGAFGDEVNVVADHAYALLEARGDGFVIYNPWGSSHPTRPLTAADLRALGVTIEVCEM